MDHLDKLIPLSTYRKVHTFKSLLRSIALGLTTAVAKVWPGERRPPPAPQRKVNVPLIFIKPRHVFYLLSQLTRLKVVHHPTIPPPPPPPVELFSSLGTVYRQLHIRGLTPIEWWIFCVRHDDLHDTINCPQIAICRHLVNRRTMHTVIHFATVLLTIIMCIQRCYIGRRLRLIDRS